MKKRGPTKEEIEARERDEKRVAHQRNLFMFLAPSIAVETLKEGMLQRAYDLLSEGEASGCDAISEFLPSRDVEEMLNAWLDDQDKDATKSRWY